MSENDQTRLDIDVSTIAPHHHTWWGVLLKVVVALALLGALVLVWDMWIQPLEDQIESGLQRLGPWAPVIYVGVFMVATSLFFPQSLLAIAAGTIFGLWWGLLWVVLSSFLTANCIFWLGRRVLRERIERFLQRHPRIKAIDDAASREGFKLAFLLRLAPVNFSTLNLVLAVSQIRYRDYVLSCVGMVLGNFSTVYMGFAARHTADLAHHLRTHHHLASDDSMVHEVTLYVGLAASVLCSIIVARVALKAIHRAQQADKASSESMGAGAG
ncbi:MAG: TVP38/TMEM64 family protein [Phycisphaerales bacterium]|nr:TVP38/TMEM64 family protein [Phycisphaerales bacterium]